MNLKGYRCLFWFTTWKKNKTTGIYSCVQDLNSHKSNLQITIKGEAPDFSLVEQSHIAALWQVFVHVTQETPQKWSLDFWGFGCIFVSVFSLWKQPWHTHTKSQCKQLHFKDLKPHLIRQTPGLEISFCLVERVVNRSFFLLAFHFLLFHDRPFHDSNVEESMLLS